MKTLKKIKKELVGENIDDVIEIFGDYKFDGISEIIVNEISNSFYSHSAHANHIEAPEILILTDEDNIIIQTEIFDE